MRFALSPESGGERRRLTLEQRRSRGRREILVLMLCIEKLRGKMTWIDDLPSPKSNPVLRRQLSSFFERKRKKRRALEIGN